MYSGEIELTENAVKVLERRYFARDEHGSVVETPEGLFHRVAKRIAEVDATYDPKTSTAEREAVYYGMLSRLEFLPNSPTLMNAGTRLGQLAACFVIPVPDTIRGIFGALTTMALIHQSGGGTGFSFSRLRPKDDIVGCSGGIASGPVSFMKIFDQATDVVKQGGKRRGANMGMLRVDHPDIIEFINAKEGEGAFRNFNLSVAVTDRFMEALAADGSYELINPKNKKATGALRAREVWDKIAHMAWKTGDPGVVFIDRVNAAQPTPQAGDIEATNPCGEQPLLPYEACNLGSLNLRKVVKGNGIDYAKLGSLVRDGVRFLDNVVDANLYPLPEIEAMTRANRKVGLGVMGFADMLAMMGVPYASERAVELAGELMRFISDEAVKASASLGRERGSFPNYAGSRLEGRGYDAMRNATVTTIAPTGTISIIAGASSGIEPFFAIAYIRRVMDGTELLEVNDLFLKRAKDDGFYSEGLMREVAGKGSLKDIGGVPDDVKRLFMTAFDIAPEWHVRMQAAFQKHVDNAVSKTVNLPHDAKPEDVSRIYWLAYSLGTKGITVYRDGSRDEQVLSVKKDAAAAPQPEPEPAEELKITPRERPEIISGTTQKLTTGCGNLYVTVNEDERGPFELFTAMGKAGGCASSQAEAISRLISLALRAGIDIDLIIKQLQGVRCPNPAWMNGELILSCADAIARSMRLYIEMRAKQGPVAALPKLAAEPAKAVPPGKAAGPAKISHSLSGEKIVSVCPDCGGHIEQQEGCLLCRGCGYSKCG